MTTDNDIKLTGPKIKTFRVRPRTLLIISFIILVFGIVPIHSVFELVTNGHVDLFERKGRRGTPAWLIYSVSWICWLWFLQVYARMLRYYRAPTMFTLGPDWIELNSARIPLAQVEMISGRWFQGDTLIEAGLHKLSFHPQLSRAGIEELRTALPDKYDPKGFVEITLLVGK